MLKLKDVSVKTKEKEKILENINASFSKNSLTLILGPNAAGKTTFAEIIGGNNNLKIEGDIFFNNVNITKESIEKRARMGILILHQNSIEIPGVKIFDFLFASYKSIVKDDLCVWDFYPIVLENMKKLKLNEDFLQRNVNEGFSGGEKKKFEILQMLLLQPKVVILDEIDSGLDIDSVKSIFEIVQEFKKKHKPAIILISHSTKILKYLKPDQVVLIKEKTIKQTGDFKLAEKILKNGYE